MILKSLLFPLYSNMANGVESTFAHSEEATMAVHEVLNLN